MNKEVLALAFLVLGVTQPMHAMMSGSGGGVDGSSAHSTVVLEGKIQQLEQQVLAQGVYCNMLGELVCNVKLNSMQDAQDLRQKIESLMQLHIQSIQWMESLEHKMEVLNECVRQSAVLVLAHQVQINAHTEQLNHQVRLIKKNEELLAKLEAQVRALSAKVDAIKDELLNTSSNDFRNNKQYRCS